MLSNFIRLFFIKFYISLYLILSFRCHLSTKKVCPSFPYVVWSNNMSWFYFTFYSINFFILRKLILSRKAFYRQESIFRLCKGLFSCSSSYACHAAILFCRRLKSHPSANDWNSFANWIWIFHRRNYPNCFVKYELVEHKEYSLRGASMHCDCESNLPHNIAFHIIDFLMFLQISLLLFLFLTSV